jgi:NAD(P)-dependent dehydrogenase (short-subunit alcohol dehydrogenase family)
LKAEYLPHDSEALYFHADCVDEAEVQKYVEKAVDLFGGIDAFVHCVGISGAIKEADNLSASEMMIAIQINIMSAFLNYKYVLPVMKKQQNGSILFFASLYGFRGVPYNAIYSMTSHAILGFMKTAALECAHSGVRINAIVPAQTNSPMMEETEKALFPSNPQLGRKHIQSYLPYGRYVEPEEIAESVLFLSSHRAKYIHGTSHIIDGGFLAK